MKTRPGAVAAGGRRVRASHVDRADAMKEPGMRDEPSGYEEALAYITERNNGWINSTAARVLVGEIVQNACREEGR